MIKRLLSCAKKLLFAFCEAQGAYYEWAFGLIEEGARENDRGKILAGISALDALGGEHRL